MQALSFSPDSLNLISVAEEDDPILWDCVTGVCVRKLEVSGQWQACHSCINSQSNFSSEQNRDVAAVRLPT